MYKNHQWYFVVANIESKLSESIKYFENKRTI